MGAPVTYTCPDINRLQQRIKDCIQTVEREVEDAAINRDIVWELDSVSVELEYLRKSNESLRKWGEDLEDEMEQKNAMIDDLEYQLELLKKEEPNGKES